MKKHYFSTFQNHNYHIFGLFASIISTKTIIFMPDFKFCLKLIIGDKLYSFNFWEFIEGHSLIVMVIIISTNHAYSTVTFHLFDNITQHVIQIYR